jgi:hypothetical protein
MTDGGPRYERRHRDLAGVAGVAPIEGEWVQKISRHGQFRFYRREVGAKFGAAVRGCGKVRPPSSGLVVALARARTPR